MILLRLKEFWESQPDTLPSGYQKAFLTKRIVLDRNGGLINIEPLSGEKRGKREGKSVAVPREQPMRTVAIRPRLVQDNANYALGLAGPEDKPDKVAARHAAYVKQLREAFEATEEPALEAVLKFVENGIPEGFAERYNIDADLDEFLFEVEGTVPTDLPSVEAFWAKDESRPQGFCLVDGVETGVVEAMPYPIKGVPGGQTAGTMLVSVNNAAGESYGQSGALNSPIGAAAAEAVCNGLNRLLAEKNHSLRVGDTVYVYWSRETTEFDFGAVISDPDPQYVGSLIATYRDGGPAPEVEAKDYYVLALTANASRIVVRDYHETTLPALQRNLGRWFERLELVGMDGKPMRPMGMFRLASSLYREAKDIPKHVPVSLVRCALTGAPLPRGLLAIAVRRNVAMQGPFYVLNGKRFISEPRLALIRACLASLPTQQEKDLTALKHDHPESAYHCGRLLSVLESIQRLAVPGLNATLVDRTYGAVSASPGTLFGGLIKDATAAHLPKLRKNSPGAYAALDERLRDVLEHVGAQFPKTLDYEGQGLFALGYYHQRASDIAEARAKKAQGKADDFVKLAEPEAATTDNGDDQ